MASNSEVGKLRILSFFVPFWGDGVCSVASKNRRLHFNLFLSPRHFPFCVVAVAAAVAVKRTGISLLGGSKKWPHTSLRAFFLSLPSSLFLAPSLFERRGEDWRRARVRSPQSCDANASDSLCCLSDDRLVFHIYTTLHFELFLCLRKHHIRSFFPSLFSHKIRSNLDRCDTDMSKEASHRLCERRTRYHAT